SNTMLQHLSPNQTVDLPIPEARISALERLSAQSEERVPALARISGSASGRSLEVVDQNAGTMDQASGSRIPATLRLSPALASTTRSKTKAPISAMLSN